MSKSLFSILIAALVAVPTVGQTTAEKREYDSLVRELRNAERSYQTALDDAGAEMRDQEGKLSNGSSAELVHRREKLDEWRSRVTAHCAMTGLPYPKAEDVTGERGNAPVTDPTADIRAQARRLVLPKLRSEALNIARSVRLPAIRPLKRR